MNLIGYYNTPNCIHTDFKDMSVHRSYVVHNLFSYCYLIWVCPCHLDNGEIPIIPGGNYFIPESHRIPAIPSDLSYWHHKVPHLGEVQIYVHV